MDLDDPFGGKGDRGGYRGIPPEEDDSLIVVCGLGLISELGL